MILSRDEAVCLILDLSQNNTISSPTKMIKLLARLNLHFIPIDIDFSLSKWGSYTADVSDFNSNSLYTVSQYDYKGTRVNKYQITPEGKQLYADTILPKIKKILTSEELESLSKEIFSLSTLRAPDISADEHKHLLVDTDDKYKLQQRINENAVDMFDLYSEINTISEDSIASIRLRALIEYCYYLMKYLKELRFKNMKEEYDFDAYMFDYYFLHNIRQIIPFLKEQVSADKKDSIRINKYYQYMVNSVRGRYPFSLDNKQLNKLIVA